MRRGCSFADLRRRPLVLLYPAFFTAASRSAVPALESATTATSVVYTAHFGRIDIDTNRFQSLRLIWPSESEAGNSMRVPIPIIKSVLGHNL